jgi:hypothetical protein
MRHSKNHNPSILSLKRTTAMKWQSVRITLLKPEAVYKYIFIAIHSKKL